MTNGNLTARMTDALEALAKYHYLMPRQFAALPRFNGEASTRRILKRFEGQKSEIACIRSGIEQGKGRIPNLFYLTRSGAELVAEMLQVEPESIFYPKGDKLPLGDVKHRAMTVDFWIQLDLHAAKTGATVEVFHPYFRTSGANRNPDTATRLRKLTRIDFPKELARKHGKPFFWADGIFILRTAQKRSLALLEIYRGIDTGRVIRQLEWHLLALEHGLPSIKYQMETGNLILMVFENDTAMQAVLNRLLQRPDFHEFASYVACSTMPRLQAEFQDWWYVWQGEIKPGALY